LSRVTQRQIAHQLGLSQSAVAFALSDNPARRKQLPAETRRRILETAERIGYVPHRAAQRLNQERFGHSRSFDQVGILYLATTSDYMDLPCHAMMSGAEHELANLHATLTFIRITAPADWRKVHRLTQAGMVDGWLVVGAVDDQAVAQLRPTGLPFVILGDHHCTALVPSLNIDHVTAGRWVVEHLARLGHRRIAFLYSALPFLYRDRMIEGIQSASVAGGIQTVEKYVPSSAVTSPAEGRLLLDWLKTSGATALFTAGSSWATSIWRLLQEAPLRVPEDISLVAYECASTTAAAQNFTRVELPMAEVGSQGVVLLHKIVFGADVALGEKNIPPTLVEGWSTRAPQTQALERPSCVPD
jgi:LacI family transcriptional regulator